MSDLKPTYEFEDDLVTASVDGKVIASGTSLEEVEQQVAEVVTEPKTASTKEASHIVTPNGLTGKILTRYAHTWGERLTVRFENGQIHEMDVTDRTQFTTEPVKKTASTNPIDRLRTAANESVAPDRDSLKRRAEVLRRIRLEAENIITKGASNEDLLELHGIIVQAEHEQREVKEALDHLDATEAEGIKPYKPEMQVIDGENVGHQSDGTWLDHTVNEMIEETRQTDFDALLDDGPTLLVAEQEDATLADAGDVRERALAHVRSKTAGLQGEQVEEYERLFVARAEDARRVELAHRKQTAKKEAAQKKSNVDNAPVESLFM